MTFIAPLIVLIAINLLTVLTFAHDKARAASGGWRVRESTLLSLAFSADRRVLCGRDDGSATRRANSRSRPIST